MVIKCFSIGAITHIQEHNFGIIVIARASALDNLHRRCLKLGFIAGIAKRLQSEILAKYCLWGHGALHCAIHTRVREEGRL